MRRTSRNVAVLASSLGLVLAVAAPASASHTSPRGWLCGFSSGEDPFIPGSQTGMLYGGPLVFEDGSTTPNPQVGTLTCTIQTGTNDTYAEADAVSLTSAPGYIVTVVGPMTYRVGRFEPVWLCSHVTVHGVTTYFDYVNGAWSHDPHVSCYLAVHVTGPPDVYWAPQRFVP